jgi:hypothetical protein
MPTAMDNYLVMQTLSHLLISSCSFCGAGACRQQLPQQLAERPGKQISLPCTMHSYSTTSACPA